MKELTLFQCEICGTQYKSEKTARECEAYHRIPNKMEAIKYRSLNGGGKYPDYINVTFNDGIVRRYKYE